MSSCYLLLKRVDAHTPVRSSRTGESLTRALRRQEVEFLSMGTANSWEPSMRGSLISRIEDGDAFFL